MFQNIPTEHRRHRFPTRLALNQVHLTVQLADQSGRRKPLLSSRPAVSVQYAPTKISSGFDTILNPYYNQAAAGTARPERLVQSVHDGDRAEPQARSLGSYISPSSSSLILNWPSRQAGDHAELQLPNRRLLRNPAGYRRRRSARLRRKTRRRPASPSSRRTRIPCSATTSYVVQPAFGDLCVSSTSQTRRPARSSSTTTAAELARRKPPDLTTT